MNPETGRIHSLEPGTPDEEVRAMGLVPLTRERAARFREMPRLRRVKAFAAEIQKLSALHPLGRVEGLTEEDIRKIRNAAKRERRARRG